MSRKRPAAVLDAPSVAEPLRIALVGFGAIGTTVAEALRDGRTLPHAVLVAVLVQRPRDDRPKELPEEVVLTTDPEAFFSAAWSVCVEAAGQPWIREHGQRVLKAGRSLLVTSVGAFTDDALYQSLQCAASQSVGRLLIAAGAMPGMDWMSSAALDQVEEAMVEQRKRPEGWKGTPAEDVTDLDALTEPVVIFEGVAREAATKFPKNANISAALALATVGLDRLAVRLVADPTVAGPTQNITFKGGCGELTIQVKGKPMTQRTSRVVPYSVVKALKNLSSPVVVGV